MRAGAKYSGASNALLNFRKEAPNRVTSTLVWDCHLSATHMMMLMLIVGLLLSHGEALARTPEGAENSLYPRIQRAYGIYARN